MRNLIYCLLVNIINKLLSFYISKNIYNNLNIIKIIFYCHRLYIKYLFKKTKFTKKYKYIVKQYFVIRFYQDKKDVSVS